MFGPSCVLSTVGLIQWVPWGTGSLRTGVIDLPPLPHGSIPLTALPFPFVGGDSLSHPLLPWCGSHTCLSDGLPLPPHPLCSRVLMRVAPFPSFPLPLHQGVLCGLWEGGAILLWSNLQALRVQDNPNQHNSTSGVCLYGQRGFVHLVPFQHCFA